jgi:hypothetical protein
MTDQFMMPGSARVSAAATFLRWARGILLVLVGLVALIVGGLLLASQNWPAATGTVGSCTTRTTTTTSHSRTPHQSCVVRWTTGTQQHQATVDFGAARKSAGESVALRVHGDRAVSASPAWLGYFVLAVGLILLVGGVLLTLRARRRAG